MLSTKSAAILICLSLILAVPCSSAIVYVNTAAPGPIYNGSSWATAYKTIQDAASNSGSGTEIWVAKGKYTGAITLSSGVSVYGGFAGTEADRSFRDWRTRATIVDGGATDTYATVVAVTAASQATFDGFIIRNANTAVSCADTGFTLANCRIYGCLNGVAFTSSGSGTAVNNFIASCTTNGVSCGTGSPTVTGNRISACGTGVYCSGGSAVITNNTIVGSLVCGILSSGSTAVSNNIVAFGGDGINRSSGTPSLFNNDVFGNTRDYYGVTAGPESISMDPGFVTADFGDFHIQPGSPCQNAGKSTAPGLSSVDFDGQERIQDGTVDIGADECDGVSRSATTRIIFVKATAPANGTGTSWATAYRTIGAATNDIALNGGAEVWVASAAYSEQVFMVPHSYLYGGFTGVETTRDQRNWKSNSTTINPSSNPWPPLFCAVLAANQARLDGFSVIPCYDGVLCRYGGGVIANNKFTSPYGQSSGMAVECRGTSVQVISNSMYGGYSGVYLESSTGSVIQNNFISGCNSGAIYAVYSKAPVISGNITVGSLYGIWVGSTPNALVLNNTCVSNAYGIYFWSCQPQLVNNISATNGYGIYLREAGVPPNNRNDVFGSRVEDYHGISKGAGDISVDPQFALTSSSDFHIQATSPCRDGGVNVAQGLPSTDFDGQARVQNEVIDIGADESDGTVWQKQSRIIYVNASAGGGDGSTWAKAITKLSSAVTIANSVGGAEIWVAKGIYTESAILTGPFVQIYGGFAGNETARTQRNWKTNVACIMPNTSAYVGAMVTATGVSVIDGLAIVGDNMGVACHSSPTITNCRISGASEYGVIAWYGTPIISGCTITSCSPYGILLSETNAIVTNNTIFGNGNYGIYSSWTGSPVISNNIVMGHTTGIYSDSNSHPVLHNNDVFGNTTNYSGVSAALTDISADPRFASLDYNDLRIQPDSPCIDRGWNDALGIPSLDMECQLRIQNGTVDIGSDESDGTVCVVVPRVVRVKSTGSNQDGTTWVRAYRTINTAVNNLSALGGGEVWVAAGTYSEQVALRSACYIVGGFAGTETDKRQRNLAVNKSIIEAGTYYVAVRTAGSSGIDGFTVRNSYAGIVHESGTGTIAHNTIQGMGTNGIAVYGGAPTVYGNAISQCGYYGVLCKDAAPVISSNTIVRNSYGVYIQYESAPVVTNNIIVRNTYDGIFAWRGSPQISWNNVHANGEADYFGIGPGDHAVSVEPLFVNEAGGNYHLAAGSPCIDAANDFGPGLDSSDIDGERRVMGTHVDLGADEYWPTASTIHEAKSRKDGAAVDVSGAIVTRLFGTTTFYVETPDRSSGIRVEKSSPPAAGTRVRVVGTMKTNTDSERYIQATTATVSGSGIIAPLAMTNESLGGGDFGDCSSWMGQHGVEKGFGLNNLGLLVKTSGIVTPISTTAFQISDGSGVTVRVVLPNTTVTVPAAGSYVSVVGIAVPRTIPTGLERDIKIKTQSDITVILQP